MAPTSPSFDWKYYLKGYFIYIVAFIPITFLMTVIEEVNTSSSIFSMIYERKTYYTTHFSIGKLLFWMALCVAGFSFVQAVNLKLERGSHFKSRGNTYNDIKKLLIIMPILYFVAPIVFLRDRYDMTRGCTIKETDISYVSSDSNSSSNQKVSDILNIDVTNAQNHQAHTISWNLFGIKEADNCHIYSKGEVFTYNYMFVIFYFIGLNWTHLDRPPFKGISLNPNSVKKWTLTQWCIVISAFVFVTINLGYLLSLFANSGMLTYILTMLSGFLAIFAIISFIKRKTHNFHLHHWTWGFCLVCLMSYQSVYTTCWAGICSGIMIEGTSRWGFGKVWGRK